MHTYIEKIGEHEGQSVTIKGWLHNRRSSGKIHFLVVRDGTGFLQVVMGKRDVDEATFTKADHLSQESAIIVTGTVKAEPRAMGGYELIASGLDVVNEAHDYPITPKEHGVDYLMDRRHLWIRTERQAAILRVRHEVINAIRDFFNSQGFILADTPIFTPAACEGTTTLFPVQYFEDNTAFLTQSGQLYNEANAMALGKVYCFGPTFRAEKSKTRRHLTEFWMVEPEMAYADLNDVINLAEGLVRSEGTTTLFPVQYFEDNTAFLTQSGQLYNEANAMALGKVYCFGPTFRAEKSKTRRHLTEFWMVEPEMAYADLNDVINLAEGLV